MTKPLTDAQIVELCFGDYRRFSQFQVKLGDDEVRMSVSDMLHWPITGLIAAALTETLKVAHD